MMQDGLPIWMLQNAPIVDPLATESSVLLSKTEAECLPFLLGTVDQGCEYTDVPPPLLRARHARYLRNALGKKLPPAFASLDASRPWMLYWCLTGLALLGEDISSYRGQYVKANPPRRRKMSRLDISCLRKL